MVVSLIAASAAGLAFLLALLFSVQDRGSVLDPASATAGGNAPMQIVWDVFAARFGRSAGAFGLLLFAIPLMSACFAGNAGLTSCSRVMWAFSRDGDTRVSRWLAKVNERTNIPLRAVVRMACACPGWHACWA